MVSVTSGSTGTTILVQLPLEDPPKPL